MADAVFFISFGGPEKSADVMPFLETVTRGRGIPRARLEEVAHHYEAIGGASPINAITQRQAEALQRRLSTVGQALPVYVGNRNWHPLIEDQLRRMAKIGVRRAIGFITAAHRAEASLERYIRAVESARSAIGPEAPEIEYVGPWFDHPKFIEAIAARAEEALAALDGEARRNVSWIFTAHSIPCAMAKESTYVIELERTASLVAERFGQTRWRLAYSSRSGNPQDAWLEPDVCDEIAAQAQAGARTILIVPIGFVADHVEVLFDLDIEAKAAADKAGVRLLRAGTVGEHPAFVEMMAEMVQERLRNDPGALAVRSSVTRLRDGQSEQSPGQSSDVCYCQPGKSSAPCLRACVNARPRSPVA